MASNIFSRGLVESDVESSAGSMGCIVWDYVMGRWHKTGGIDQLGLRMEEVKALTVRD